MECDDLQALLVSAGSLCLSGSSTVSAWFSSQNSFIFYINIKLIYIK